MSYVEQVLRQPSVRDGMKKLFQRRLESDDITNLRNRLRDCLLEVDLREVTRTEMQNLIMSRLVELPGCTVDDVYDAWEVAIAAQDAGRPDFDSAYDHFCKHLSASMALFWRSEPLPLAPRIDFVASPAREALWQSADEEYDIQLLCALPVGVRMRFAENFSDEDDCSTATRLFISAEGMGSERFFRQFCDAVVTTLSSVLDGLLKLNRKWLERALYAGSDEERDRCLKNFLRGKNLNAPSGTANAEEQGEWLLDCPTLRFLRNCLDAVFADVATKKDSVQRRIKIGVRLIVEGMEQSENAVGLALCVSAIEAMLCRRSENVAATFAENMAVLLEPDPQFRLDAERWCKRLYDLRSQVLHGSSIDLSADEMSEAQMASVAVLKAYIERREGVRRLQGEDDNPQAIFEELTLEKYGKGPLLFVEETPLNVLWRRRTATG